MSKAKISIVIGKKKVSTHIENCSLWELETAIISLRIQKDKMLNPLIEKGIQMSKARDILDDIDKTNEEILKGR